VSTIRVLEVSASEAAAAYCGMLFARWGASVTRLEPTTRGDGGDAARLYLHHAKQVDAIDLDAPDGAERLSEHVDNVDVVICDLDVAEIDEWTPILERASVCTLITPFGRHGPRRNAPATASTLLALGGYTLLSGDAGRSPLTLPGNYPYYQAGSFAFVASLAEYLRAQESSHATVDVAVLETLATLHQFTDTMWTFDGIVRSRHGNRWENLCPTTLLPCEDGWIALNVLPGFWESFALWVGGPELAADTPFTTPGVSPSATRRR
jgi:crotonobetainyl-CoA:carnitine CoA-transferase CaiB-like acyl-CoA transferase